MGEKMKAKIVFLYSLLHFLVDLACALLVIHLVCPNLDSIYKIVLAETIYNFFAFAMQLPIGIIADYVNKNAILAAAGCLIVAASFAFSKIGLLACFVAGVGNALFHVGGGIDVLNISNKKAMLSGIFVSTGAMGIFLGGKAAYLGFTKFYLVVIPLIIAAPLLIMLYRSIKDKVKNEEFRIPDLGKAAKIAIVCLMLTVVIRGYVGLILAFEWKSNFILALISIFAVVFGKMLGGIIGDKIGYMKTSIFSLVVSSILYIFAFESAVCGIIATLLFNMTMPITLIALSNMFPNAKGTAFGMLTFALFLGAVPVILGFNEVLFNPV